MRGLRHCRAGYCLWCGGPPDRNKRTTEHFIPKWVIRELPHLSIPYNLFTACKVCNERRGPMPAALYMSIRDNSSLVAKSAVYWHAVAQLITKLRNRDDIFYDRLRREAEISFGCLIPEETGTLDPRIQYGRHGHNVRSPQNSMSMEEWRHMANNYDSKQMVARMTWFLGPNKPPGKGTRPNDGWPSMVDDPDAPRFIRTGGEGG